MSEKIQAIRGSKERAEEVKQWLRNQGAMDIEKCFFDNEYRVYFVDNNKCVRSCSIKNEILFDIVEVPVKKPLLQVILGSIKRSKEVIQVLEDMGGINTNNMTGDAFHCYYYINSEKCICRKSRDDSFFDDYVLEILILPKKVKPTLKVIKGVDSCSEGERIITTLENLGGHNECHYVGDAGCDFGYYINNENRICRDSIDYLNQKYELEFIELPEDGKVVVPSLEAQQAVVEQKAILEAYVNGEKIERCPKAGANRTFEEIESAGHLFNFCLYDYRVKSKRWRAEKGDSYYYINYDLCVEEEMECSEESDGSCYEVGNYFHSREQAEKARDLVKETLIKFHSENEDN